METTIDIYEPTSPLGDGGFAICLDEPPEHIYNLFQNTQAKSFFFYGNGNYLEFAPVKEAANSLMRYFRQLTVLIWQVFRSETYTFLGQKIVRPQPPAPTSGNPSDFFCQSIATKQVIQNGKYIQILYPDNPITKHHFLFVTKAHRKDFREITEEEFSELLDLAKRVADFFDGEKYYLCKAGIDAGQTVPHFHLHMFIVETLSDSFWGRLKIFSNIIFNALPFLNSRLEGEALQGRVEYYREQLADV